MFLALETEITKFQIHYAYAIFHLCSWTAKPISLSLSFLFCNIGRAITWGGSSYEKMRY